MLCLHENHFPLLVKYVSMLVHHINARVIELMSLLQILDKTCVFQIYNFYDNSKLQNDRHINKQYLCGLPPLTISLGLQKIPKCLIVDLRAPMTLT